jgi:hypothetical protein
MKRLERSIDNLLKIIDELKRKNMELLHQLEGGHKSMKSVFVGKEATIAIGKCAGISGMVVGANSEKNTVEIHVEKGTYITTTYDNITQN